jgi:hypothetical protein
MITDEFYKQILLCFVDSQSLPLSDIFCKLEPVFKNTEHALIFLIMKEMETVTSMIDIRSNAVYITESGTQALFHILGLEYENRIRVVRNLFGKPVDETFRAVRLRKTTSSPRSNEMWWFANFDNATRYLKLDYAADAGKIIDTELSLTNVAGITFWSSMMSKDDDFVRYQINEYRHISAEFAKLILE